MIINTLLDTDFYKFTQQQFVYHQFPDVEVEYKFICRDDVDLSNLYLLIKKEIDHLCDLKFEKYQIEYLESLGYFKPDYLKYLESFQLNKNHIRITKNPFTITIKGNWTETILFETPVLAIISELYCINRTTSFNGFTKLSEKIELIKNEDIKFADFGTRRRYGSHWQLTVLEELINEVPNQFVGTSNVEFSRKLNMEPIGTMAHEILQSGQSLSPNLEYFQEFIMQLWLEEYNGELGIVLTDVINMDSFLYDFYEQLVEKYQGCRQDSGDPFEWGDKLLTHYYNNDIDPKEKIAVFSDGLDFGKMIQINNYFKNSINCLFGIGTNLTNDVGVKPLNIVIKMIKCNDKPVAKISDSPGKEICIDEKFLKKLKEIFMI